LANGGIGRWKGKNYGKGGGGGKCYTPFRRESATFIFGEGRGRGEDFGKKASAISDAEVLAKVKKAKLTPVGVQIRRKGVSKRGHLSLKGRYQPGGPHFPLRVGSTEG